MSAEDRAIYEAVFDSFDPNDCISEEEYIEELKDIALYGDLYEERYDAMQELKSRYGIVIEDASDKQSPEDTL